MKWKGGWLRPTSFANRINDISFEVLQKDGIVGIIVDLDNTLVGYRIKAPEQAVTQWVRDAAQRGFKVVMVTNNATSWARNIALHLNIPCIPNARKPSPRGFLRAMRLIETDRRSTVVIGDQLFTDVLGAKLFGMKVILTEPIVPREEWWMRFLRFFERLVLYRVPRV